MSARLKYRWSIGHNYLAGITAGDWWRLLRGNDWAVDAVYWHRAAFISAVSLLNAWHRRNEERVFSEQIRATKISQPPVFILGHWRSGTTHLHNLLAQDDTHFAYPNTYQVINPHTFLTTEKTNTRRFAWLLPPKRPMDNMALNFQSPQEDEFAPLLTCLMSSYLGVTFPRHEEKYDKYLTFCDASREERTTWKNAFEWFLKKLTFKYPNRTLLLKSPPHTARIRLLLEMFPTAKFIHIHRDPATVFQSFRHYYDTAMWHTYLQKPDRTIIDQQIIQRYRTVFAAYFADLPLIPPGHFHEVAFADLERDPVGTTAKIYQKLLLPNFATARPKIAAYVNTLQGYEKNQYPTLNESEKHLLRDHWQPYYQRWGYEI